MSFFNRHSHGFCWDYLWLLVVRFLIKKGNNPMMSIGRNNTLQNENFEECFLIYVRPQGKKSSLWICFNAYRLSLSMDFYAVFAAVSACCVPVSHADVLARFAFRAVCAVF